MTISQLIIYYLVNGYFISFLYEQTHAHCATPSLPRTEKQNETKTHGWVLGTDSGLRVCKAGILLSPHGNFLSLKVMTSGVRYSGGKLAKTIFYDLPLFSLHCFRLYIIWTKVMLGYLCLTLDFLDESLNTSLLLLCLCCISCHRVPAWFLISVSKWWVLVCWFTVTFFFFCKWQSDSGLIGWRRYHSLQF